MVNEVIYSLKVFGDGLLRGYRFICPTRLGGLRLGFRQKFWTSRLHYHGDHIANVHVHASFNVHVDVHTNSNTNVSASAVVIAYTPLHANSNSNPHSLSQ